MTRLSIRKKIMFVFMLVFVVALLAIFTWVYIFANQVATTNLQEDLMTSATTAASLITQEDFEAAQADPEGEAHDYITDLLDVVLYSNLNLAQVYAMVPTDSSYEEFRVVISVFDEEYGDLFIPEGELYDAFDNFDLQYAYEEPTYSDLRMDDYGIWISGYAPIWDENGDTVGIIGADMLGEDLLYVRGQILLASLAAFVLSCIAVFLAAYFISGAITKPLQAVIDAAGKLEKDEPFEPNSLEAVSRVSDEIGKLARVFSEMAVQVQEREQQLKQKIVSLQIQIDEKKRAQSVSEIVDTDYFRDLQKRAKSLRENDGDDKGK